MTKVVTILLIILNTGLAAEELRVGCPSAEVEAGTRLPVRVTFSEQMIPFGYSRDSVSNGLSLRPSIAGKWSWSSQSLLQFVPDSPWPSGIRYE